MELGVVTKESILNPNLGDLALGANGDEVMISDLSTEVGQRLWVSFNFFLGEWFLNLDEGTPWFQRILGKGVGDRVIRAVLGQVILQCEGVAQLNRFSYEVSRQRVMTVRFTCTLEDGTTFKSTEFAPFIIQL